MVLVTYQEKHVDNLYFKSGTGRSNMVKYAKTSSKTIQETIVK